MKSGAWINQLRVEFEPGETILQVAQRHGIDIPTLCHHTGLRPVGGCRLCMVEVAGDKKTSAACHTHLMAEQRVTTDTPRLQEQRQWILKLLIASQPDNYSNVSTTSPFAELLAQCGVGVAGSETSSNCQQQDHPYLDYRSDLCVQCRKCLQVCEQVQGQFVYDMTGRGAQSRLAFGIDDRFSSSECVACGACINVCPSQALRDTNRQIPSQDTVDSVCGFCGVGCRIQVSANEKGISSVTGVADAAVNHGHLCAKGRYARAFTASEERLTEPLERTPDGLKPVSWQRALTLISEKIRETVAQHGADACAILTSSRAPNESAYLAQKLFRSVVGTNNVDCCARICHSSTALALRTVTGTGAASASYADIDRANCIVVAGANPTEAHPVVGARIKQAVLNGARLIVIDPRSIELAQMADYHLQLFPGTNVALFNGLAKIMVERKLYDKAYVAERLEDWEPFVGFVSALELSELAQLSQVSLAAMHGAAELMCESGPVLFVHGLGLSELTQGTASVMGLCNLGMLTGSIGKKGAGMLPLRGQNNVQGNADMGGMPNLVTGYQPLDNPQVRQRLKTLWGTAPPQQPGLKSPDMLEAARQGQLKLLWLQGEDAVQSDPHTSAVVEALEKLDFLIIQDLFLNETTPYAHLVLPAACSFEQDGTFTNGERRIQRVRQSVPAPGQAYADWRVFYETAQALGADWHYQDSSQVMDEIAQVAPHLFGGVSYARLQQDGLQWPCPDETHPGTSSVHQQGFLRGKGLLMMLPYVANPEHDLDHFPLTLITGRVLHHYNVGSMTRRTPQAQLVSQDVLEMNPADAHQIGVTTGSRVTIISRWGRASLTAQISDRMAPGTLFASFHFPETGINQVTGPHTDPDSLCPQYKVTAVRIERCKTAAPAKA